MTQTVERQGEVEELVREARDLPAPERSLLTHNERELVVFAGKLADALEALQAREKRLREALEEARSGLQAFAAGACAETILKIDAALKETTP